LNAKIRHRLFSLSYAVIFFVAVWGIPTPANADELGTVDLGSLVIADSPTGIAQVVEFDTPFMEQLVFYPTDGGAKVLSSGFGYRSTSCLACSTNHQGSDFTPGYGKKVYAVSYGKVVQVGWESGYGFSIRIKHDASTGLGGVTTLYAHLIENSNFVKVGDEVIPRQKIGKVGQTGITTGPHLHFEVRVDGNTVDPMTWLKQHRAKSK
jgi:murein DD-endopeptidase MepM/ murein hydrolase activator NlpD